jgi:DNA-binding CsgD family transcriptional regulator
MPVASVLLNLVLFVGLGVYALLLSKRTTFESIRLLWRLAVLPVAALFVSGLYKLVVQAARVGWLPTEGLEFLLHDWQVVQSLVVTAIAGIAFRKMSRLARRLSDLELLAGGLVDRVIHVDLDSLKLTPREREVLRVIASSSLIDDKSLAEKLSVSPSTAHTHVLSLLRKTKLHNRHELSVLAYLDQQYQGTPGSSAYN